MSSTWFATGDVVAYRDTQRGRLLWETLHVVVEDSKDRVVL